jgi:hypothetical protein
MLQGEAKRAYMRDWMRRKRAGEPTRKPKPREPKKPSEPKKPWQPTQRMINEVGHWFYLQLNRAWHLRVIGAEVVYGLDPHNTDGTVNDAAWTEALQRYRTLRAEQRVERKRKQPEQDAPPASKRSSFCGEPASEERVLVGNGYQMICATCTEEAAAIFAEHRKRR